MRHREAWIEGEPSLEDLMRDTIFESILLRDGLTRQDVRQAVETARRSLRTREERSSEAA